MRTRPALAVVIMAAAALSARAQTVPGATARAELKRQVAAGGRTVAVLTLPEAAAKSTGPVDDARRREVAERWARFKTRLDPAHVVVRHAFESFPGAVVILDAAGLDALGADPEVDSLVPDLPIHAQLVQSVPLIRADLEVAHGGDGHGVTVAVLDTGINATHQDLSAAVLGTGYHSLDQGTNVGVGGVMDDNGHGSNVSGIVASRGVVSGVGVAPQSRIFPVKVLKSDASGWISDWVIGVDYVTAHRTDVTPAVRVLNMSLGSTAVSSSCPCDNEQPAFARATAAARASGIAITVSAGNAGQTGAMPYPACFSSVLPVGATYDANLGRRPAAGTFHDTWAEFAACFDATTAARGFACFTNRSMCLKLVAPGAEITSDYLGASNALSTYTGTSQAAPHAAGVAADLLSLYPNLTVDQVYTALLASTQPMIADPVVAGQSYLFLDARDADAYAACLTTCAPAGGCDTASCQVGGACQHAPKAAGQSCGAVCQNGQTTLSTCSANATCVAGTPQVCGAYACASSGDHCLTSCTASTECTAGNECQTGVCQPGGCTVGPGGPGSASGSALVLLGAALLLVRVRRRGTRP